MDFKQLMEMATQMRGQLADAQRDAQSARFTGEAGGGMVRVVINGRHEALEVAIDPAAVDPSDLSLLEDLVRAAFNAASHQVATKLQEQFGGLAQGLGLDLSNLNPGGGGGSEGGEE